MRELEERLYKHINTLIERYPKLEGARQSIIDAYLIMEECYENGGKLLIAGNGGGAAGWGFSSGFGAYCGRVDEAF